MSHLDQVAVIRHHIAQHKYSEALLVGRHELARGRDSAELLVLMATVILLGDGNGGSLEEARQWLERATSGDPRSVDASLELAHFLDSVADEQQLAARGFESAGMQALGYLEDALAGLASTGSAAVELRRRITEVLKDAAEGETSGSTS
jgi:hypothetical protein